MNEPTPIVFVVDDDPSIRTAVARLLGSVGLRAEGYPSAEAVLDRLTSSDAGCVVLDIRMPGPSGLDLQASLAAKGVRLPILFLTGHADVPITVRAMKAGAREVLTKPFRDQDLLDAVGQALEEDRLARSRRSEVQQLSSRFARLTPRERQVMQLVVAGLPNKRIAAELGAAEKTIKVHRAAVMTKMQAESLADLVHMADRLPLEVRAKA
jgi:FixJ family two-component response regulator